MAEIASARLATFNHVALSGLGKDVDGTTVGENDEILLAGQYVQADNGIYLSKSGAWERRADFATIEQMLPDTHLKIREGVRHAGSRWYLANSHPLASVSEDKIFRKESHGKSIQADESMQIVGFKLSRHPRLRVSGRYAEPKLSVDSSGFIEDAGIGNEYRTFVTGLEITVIGDVTSPSSEVASITQTKMRISVAPGAAYVPALDRILSIEEAVELEVMKPSDYLTNQLQYVYLMERNDVAEIRVHPGPPLHTYKGNAKTRDNDAYKTWRYVGAFNMLKLFERRSGDRVLYRAARSNSHSVNIPDTTWLDLKDNLAGHIPDHAQIFLAHIHLISGGNLQIGIRRGVNNNDPIDILWTASAPTTIATPLPLFPDNRTYIRLTSAGSANLYSQGYMEPRA